MLTLNQFKAMADSYGADLRRWPEEVRTEAEALLDDAAVSARARAILADAWILDEAIAAASALETTTAWHPGESDAALARLRAGVTARIESATGRQRTGLIERVLAATGREAVSRHFGWAGMATSAGLAVLAGILIGSMYSPAATPDTLLSVLQPAPIQVLAE